MKFFRKKWFWICLVLLVILAVVIVVSSEKGSWSWRVLYRIFPSALTQTQIGHEIRQIRPVSVNCITGWPPKWEYELIFLKDYYPITIPKGTRLTIEAIGIDSGSVIGKAALPEFGAWQLKEITHNHITFISTKEAKTPLAMPGFVIISSNGKDGLVKWIYEDGRAKGIYGDYASGAYTGATGGPFPKD